MTIQGWTSCQSQKVILLKTRKMIKHHIIKYHSILLSKERDGTTLEGPACRHLLKQSNTLLNPDFLGDVEQEKVLSFIRTSKIFNVLVHKWFCTDIVNMKKVKKELPYFQGRGLGICLKLEEKAFISISRTTSGRREKSPHISIQDMGKLYVLQL